MVNNQRIELIRLEGRLSATAGVEVVDGWVSYLSRSKPNLSLIDIARSMEETEYREFRRAHKCKLTELARRGIVPIPPLPEHIRTPYQKLKRDEFTGQSSVVPVAKPQGPVPKKLDTQEFLREQARGAKGDVR